MSDKVFYHKFWNCGLFCRVKIQSPGLPMVHPRFFFFVLLKVIKAGFAVSLLVAALLQRSWVEDGRRGSRFDLSTVFSVVERRNTNGEKAALRVLVPNFFFHLDVIPYLRFAAIFPHITPLSNNAAIECEFIPYPNFSVQHSDKTCLSANVRNSLSRQSRACIDLSNFLAAFLPRECTEIVKTKKKINFSH